VVVEPDVDALLTSDGELEPSAAVLSVGEARQSGLSATSALSQLLGCVGYPESGVGVPRVLAMGDSYSAGEGLDCYQPGTDQADNQCHRSDFAYSAYVQAGLEHRFVACSGALIKHILEFGQWGEGRQLDEVNTSFETVMLTIGGNDVGFADIVTKCFSINGVYARGSGCDSLIAAASKKISGIGQPSMSVRLESAYRAILARMAPDAELVVGKYPMLTPASGDWTGIPVFGGGRFCVAGELSGFSFGFLEPDVTAMHSLQVQLNSAIVTAADNIAADGDTRIRVADTSFPDHSIPCGDPGRPTPYVNGIRFAPGAGAVSVVECLLPFVSCEGLLEPWISMASFHPNVEGQQAMSVAFSTALSPPSSLSIVAPRPEALRVRELSFYALDLDAVGSREPLTWTITSGTLPDGLTLDAQSGRITGYPTGIGNYALTVEVTTPDGGTSASRQFVIELQDIGPCTILFVRNPFNSSDRLSLTDTSNWLPPRLPGPADVACIDGGDVTTVSVDQPVTIGAILARRLVSFEVDSDLTIAGVVGFTKPFDLNNDGDKAAPLTITGTLQSQDNVTLPPWTRLSGSLSGSGSFVVSAGSVLESWDGDVRAGLVNRGTLSTGCGGNRLLGVYAAVVVNEGIVTSCDNSSGTVRQQADGASLVNTASGRIEPGSDATLFLDVPVVNEGTITIGAGRTVVVADSVLGGVWGGEGTLDVDGGGELVAASDATVTLAGALTRLSGSLSGSGSFVVSAGSVLESWDGDVRAGLVNRGTLSTGCGGNRLLGVYAAVVVNEGIVTSCDNSSGTVRQQADGASLVNTASGRIEPGSDATLFLDVPVVNEGTITIGAGRTVVVADSVLGGVWGGEGTLDVDGGGELVAASDATVTLWSVRGASLSGSGSFVVSAGSVLDGMGMFVLGW
jgi:hypothetical protein